MKLRERLAEIEHDRWAGWMIHMFEKGVFNEDGTWTMPKWAVDRWIRQSIQTYDQLTEEEKDSDRKEVDITLAVLNDYGIKTSEAELLEELRKTNPKRRGHEYPM